MAESYKAGAVCDIWSKGKSVCDVSSLLTHTLDFNCSCSHFTTRIKDVARVDLAFFTTNGPKVDAENVSPVFWNHTIFTKNVGLWFWGKASQKWEKVRGSLANLKTSCFYIFQLNIKEEHGSNKALRKKYLQINDML